MQKKVSIVIPARYEEETIAPVLDEINRTIASLKSYAFEVLVVVDHPDDPTVRAAESRNAKVLLNDKLRGKGNALYYGFRNSTGDVIAILDADGSHNPSDLGLFLAEIDKGAGLVIGSRVLGGSSDHNVIRLFGNALFTVLFSILFSTTIMDTLNGYKVFVRDAVTGYKPRTAGLDVEIEIVSRAVCKGLRLVEVPSHENRRAGGKMKSRAIRDGFLILRACLREGLRYRFGRLLGRYPRPAA